MPGPAAPYAPDAKPVFIAVKPQSVAAGISMNTNRPWLSVWKVYRKGPAYPGREVRECDRGAGDRQRRLAVKHDTADRAIGALLSSGLGLRVQTDSDGSHAERSQREAHNGREDNEAHAGSEGPA